MQLSTKERAINAALTLFAEKGYDGVGVDQIAEAVGIKGPSLYKHFKGKEDILCKLMDRVGEHYDANFGSSEHPGKIPESTEELVQMSLGRVNFSMHDETIQKVRRVLAMEQFRSSRIAEEATKHYIDGLEGMYEKILGGMMEKGILKDDDPRDLAVELISPITLLIHMYDRQPEREQEALERIEKHLRHFVKVYGK